MLEETLAILKRHNIRLKKGLSQNFLIDSNIKKRIIEELKLTENDTIFEIGSGIGLISKEIAPRVKRVICCEIDPNLIPILKENLGNFKNIEIIEKDILKLDLYEILKEKTKVFGSLPYHITTPIIFHLLKFRERLSLTLLILQYEVSKRLILDKGRNLNTLSIILQIYTKPEFIMKIGPGSFIPKPKPYSALIKLEFREKPKIEPSPYFFKIVELLFLRKRKKIANSLEQLKIPKEKLISLLKKAGIDPNIRVSHLSIFDIEKIALEYQNL